MAIKKMVALPGDVSVTLARDVSVTAPGRGHQERRESMGINYQVDLGSLKIMGAQILNGARPPIGEGYELVTAIAIAERLEALVEETHRIGNILDALKEEGKE